jgi:hypothetical protein
MMAAKTAIVIFGSPLLLDRKKTQDKRSRRQVARSMIAVQKKDCLKNQLLKRFFRLND